MSTRPREKFNKDLVIAADDGNLYLIPVDAYTSEKYRITRHIDGPEYQLIRGMVAGGSVCAAIPEPEAKAAHVAGAKTAHVVVAELSAAPPPSHGDETTDVGRGISCYMINLASLRWQTPFEKP